MKPLWTKKDLMSATSGSDPSKYFLENVNGIWGISINDRTLKKGDLFIALKGDKFNGHDFIKFRQFNIFFNPFSKDIYLVSR